jgi:acetyl-CoA C-acetyltransferase
MREVVIVGYLRTPQSRSRPTAPERDVFHKLRADDLLARLLPEVLKRSKVEPAEVDDFLVGAAVGVNENFTYGGRYPIFLANLPETIPAKFVDQQCGSSMAGIQIGFMEIATGFADTVLVGGMEHQTRNYGATLRQKEGAISPNPRFFEDESMAHWDFTTVTNMGFTAEKL